MFGYKVFQGIKEKTVMNFTLKKPFHPKKFFDQIYKVFLFYFMSNIYIEINHNQGKSVHIIEKFQKGYIKSFSF